VVSFCDLQGSLWSLRRLHFYSGFRTPPFFVHFAFTASGTTNWMEEVTADDYKAGFD